MKFSWLVSLALGVSWIFSPEALVIAGNVTGQMGWFTFPSLAGVILVYAVCARLLRHDSLSFPPGSGPDREFFILERGGGRLVAATLSLAGCLPLTILAGTALLVTAGYAFNEVFLYWFPNFGFAFLLLALLTVLQLLRKEYALWMQLILTALPQNLWVDFRIWRPEQLSC